MYKVFLGIGHGGKDKGAVKYLVESDINLNMGLACRDYLVANGVEVKMSREKDETDTLAQEIKECNAYNPDLAVDIHNNAGGGDGFEVFYHHLGGRSKTLAQNIEKEILSIGQNSRGCKVKLNSKGNSDYYGFIRQIKATSVIVEGLFVDNKTDIKIGDTLEEQKKFGVAIAKGILKTLGVKENKTTSKPTVSYYPKCGSYHISIIMALNSIGVDSSKANRKKIAIANGIKDYNFSFSQNVKLLNLLKTGKLIKV